MEPDYTLIEAVETGDLRTVVAWLDLAPGLLEKRDWVERLLNAAISQDREDVLSLLLERGVDVNIHVRGGTLLHLATSGNCPNCVNLVLGAGVNPSIRDSEGLPPLYYAALRSMDGDILQGLARRAEPVDLNTAVALGDLGLIRQILVRDKDGIRNAPQPAKLLKDAIWLQTSPSLLVNEPKEPQAVRPTRDIISLLLQAGADPNQAWGNHLPPLFEALSATNFDPGIVELLLQNGADITQRTREGESVWQYAQSAASPQAVSLIEQAYRRRGIDPRVEGQPK